MQGWMMRWLLNILAILLTAAIAPHFAINGWWAAVVGSVFLGIINAVIRPLVIVLTLPLNVLTLGLFTFVINGFMLWITSITVRNFDIDGFGWAIIAAFILTILSGVISFFVEDRPFQFR
ncbi:MAG TPA: phage holin family protein [Syntrophomonadaceae bacterium]|nr:phage holin family protein [Syntrophomonadaceae bacterium]